MIHELKFNLKTNIGNEKVDCMYLIKPYKNIGYQVACMRLDNKEVILNKAFKRGLEKGSSRKTFAKLRDYAITKVEAEIQTKKGVF